MINHTGEGSTNKKTGVRAKTFTGSDQNGIHYK